jgi:hypothetical protein
MVRRHRAKLAVYCASKREPMEKLHGFPAKTGHFDSYQTR